MSALPPHAAAFPPPAAELVPGTTLLVPLDDASRVGEARRAAVAVGTGCGLDADTGARLALVATETASNLVKHARGGVLLVRVVAAGPAHDPADPAARRGVELLAVDQGPGMADLARASRDGYSTAGSAGAGLGAMRRMADAFDVDSRPGRGTVLVARVWAPAPPDGAAAPAFALGAVSLPAPGEHACGDAWAAVEADGRLWLMVADGLGHGPLAAAAARPAARLLRTVVAGGTPAGPVEVVERAHLALRATRGAAVSVAVVDPAARTVRFAGIGNVAGAVVTAGDARSMVAHNGIVGHEMRRAQEFAYGWSPDAVVVLASDGLRTQWRLEAYAGLLARDPALVAATLWRDCTRGRDDATVLAARPVDHAADPGRGASR